jgi:hypothetical protein
LASSSSISSRDGTVEHDDRDVTAEFKVAEGESAVFAMDEVGSDAVPRPCSGEEAEELLAATVAFWRSQLSASRRQRQPKIQASWPWTADIVTAWHRISALPHAP